MVARALRRFMLLCAVLAAMLTLPAGALAATWSAPTLIAPQLVTTSVSCPSATFCAAVGGANAVALRRRAMEHAGPRRR